MRDPSNAGEAPRWLSIPGRSGDERKSSRCGNCLRRRLCTDGTQDDPPVSSTVPTSRREARSFTACTRRRRRLGVELRRDRVVELVLVTGFVEERQVASASLGVRANLRVGERLVRLHNVVVPTGSALYCPLKAGALPRAAHARNIASSTSPARASPPSASSLQIGASSSSNSTCENSDIERPTAVVEKKRSGVQRPCGAHEREVARRRAGIA